MKFKDIYSIASGLTRRDNEGIFEALSHLTEEVGEFAAAVRSDYNLKGEVPEPSINEAADIVLQVVEVLTILNISYDEFKVALKLKLNKWETKRKVLLEE